MPDNNPLIEFITLYRSNPVTFVQEVLGIDPDPWQATLLNAISRGERRISVTSGHGTGKSSCASWAMVWYILTRYPVKIVVTAPTSKQLFDALFAELLGVVNKLPPALRELLNATQERIELAGAPSECFISARTARAEQPEALQGVHSENVMLIVDEASGVPEAVFEAASGSMSGYHAVTVLLGNPVRSSGLFYDSHHSQKDRWFTIKISCLDSPRCTPDFIEDMKARYGADSNAFRVRVLGEFPLGDDDTLIPIELVDGAMNREVIIDPLTPEIWGLDVARYGSDCSCLIKRRGKAVISKPRIWNNLDLMQLTGAVVAEYNDLAEQDRPVEILVDSVGLGGGVTDRIRELKLPCRGINVTEVPSMAGRYHRLRDELWHKCRDWLDKRDCSLPRDNKLMGELCTPRFKYLSNGKIQVEMKEEMKARGFKSPNMADALCLTFASDAGVALYGSSFTSDWNRRLKRGLSLV